MVKVWWKSKTLWVNGIALIATLIQAKWGFAISPEIQGILLTIVNLILRIETGEMVVLRTPKE